MGFLTTVRWFILIYYIIILLYISVPSLLFTLYLSLYENNE